MTALIFLVYISLLAQTSTLAGLRVSTDGSLFVTTNGRERKIADGVAKAWLLTGGLTIAYSTDGDTGFEKEGQALHLYDIVSGRATRILNEPFIIIGLQEVKSSGGKTALLVSMEDGGLGASHIALVDPTRGEVFREDGAVFAPSAPGTIAVKWYNDPDWEKLQANAAVKPYKTRSYNLDELLGHSVLTNNH